MLIGNKKEIIDFSLIIETLSRKKRLSYMDAILYHCDKTGLEVEVASKLINNKIKAQLKQEAEDLNFLPKSKIKRLLV